MVSKASPLKLLLSSSEVEHFDAAPGLLAHFPSEVGATAVSTGSYDLIWRPFQFPTTRTWKLLSTRETFSGAGLPFVMGVFISAP